ncbi:MAG: DUF1646 family protein [Candidatus Methanoperedens sp.]
MGASLLKPITQWKRYFFYLINDFVNHTSKCGIFKKIAGRMLIPGNILNIISANKLGITIKEWAKLGVPLKHLKMVV